MIPQVVPRWSGVPGLKVRWRQPLLLEAAVLLALTGAAAAAFARSLRANTVYDEGVYLASVDALAHGQKLGSQVFASQPPGFYLLLEAERTVLGGSLVSMRVGMLLLGLVGLISAYSIGRSVAGPRGGFLAAGLLATPLLVEQEAVRVRGDVPAMALSLLAIALALLAVQREGVGGAVAATLAGAALAAAVSVKLVAATAVVPVCAIALRRGGRRLAPLAAGILGVGAALVALYGGVIGALWNEAVRFHLKAQSVHIAGAPKGPGGNMAKIISSVTDARGVGSPFLWLVLLGAVGTLLAWRRRQLLEAVPLWLWPAASVLFLVWHRPLWEHDVVFLTAGLAVAAGVGLAALPVDGRLVTTALVAACVVVIAATIAERLQRASGAVNPGLERAAAVLRTRTTRGSEVASDLPIVPFLANRRQPGQLVDTSSTRIRSGSLSARTIIRAISPSRVSAVVLGHDLALIPQVVRAVRARFPLSIHLANVRLGGEKPSSVRLYLRSQR